MLIKMAGKYLTPSNVKAVMKEVGEDYPAIIKTFNGERSAVSLKKLIQYKDGIKEAWLPTERNWELITKHGMDKLERITDEILQYWN